MLDIIETVCVLPQYKFIHLQQTIKSKCPFTVSPPPFNVILVLYASFILPS